MSWNHQERWGCRLALLLILQQSLLQSEPGKMKTGWHEDRMTIRLRRETYGASDDPPQGVPGPFIKPVEEFVEAVGGEMVRWSVVEPEGKEEKKPCWVKSKITRIIKGRLPGHRDFCLVKTETVMLTALESGIQLKRKKCGAYFRTKACLLTVATTGVYYRDRGRK